MDEEKWANVGPPLFLPCFPLSLFVVFAHLGCDMSGTSVVDIAAPKSKRPVEKLLKTASGSGRPPKKALPDHGALAKLSPYERNFCKLGRKS